MSESLRIEVINEKPLVTFALITYNQEKFVREAVANAFSQTYSPLEIILSDDCSSDQTYEILKEMVKDYDGVHKVVLRQTPKNLGVLSHVLNAVNGAHGEFIVLAAGDDISKPERTRKLVDIWQATGAWGVHSRFDRIDEYGTLFGISERSNNLLSPEYRLRQYFYDHDGGVDIVHGVTSAYDRRIFTYLKNKQTDHILSEDGVLSLIINLINEKVAFIESSLVYYRSHQGSITNSVNKDNNFTFDNIRSGVKKSEDYSLSTKFRAQLLLNLADTIKDKKLRLLNKKEIYIDIKFYELASSWVNSSFSKRFVSLLNCRNKDKFIWILQRLFGFNFFVTIKFLIRRIQNLIQSKN